MLSSPRPDFMKSQLSLHYMTICVHSRKLIRYQSGRPRIPFFSRKRKDRFRSFIFMPRTKRALALVLSSDGDLELRWPFGSLACNDNPVTLDRVKSKFRHGFGSVQKLISSDSTQLLMNSPQSGPNASIRPSKPHVRR